MTRPRIVLSRVTRRSSCAARAVRAERSLAWRLTSGARLAGTVTLAACVTSPAAHTPARTPAPMAAAAPAAPPAFTFHYAPGQYTYDVTTSAVVFAAPDTSVPADSVRSSAVLRLELTPSPDGRLLVSGAVDSIVTRTSRDSGAIASPTMPFHGVLDSAGTLVSLQGADTATCNDEREVAFALVRYVLPAIPARLTPDSAATDTLSVQGCRGGIPITATSVRTYRLGANGAGTSAADGTAIERISQLSLTGSGVRGADSVTISGQGSAAADLHVSPATSRFLSSVEHSVINIQFAASGVQRHFRQEATISVRAR